MTSEETLAMIQWLALIDPRHGTGDDQTKLVLKAKAWHEQLPIALTIADAKSICSELISRSVYLTPGAIGNRFDELRSPMHQQSVTRQPRPLDAPRREPPPRTELPPAGKPLDGPETTAAVTGLGLKGGRTNPVLSVPCAYCRAPVGQPCIAAATGKPLTHRPGHPSREDAYDQSRSAGRT